MYFVFLVEDKSGKFLIEEIMKKFIINHPNILYRVVSFKGIGSLPKKNKNNNVKTYRLLNDLPIYLKGISKQLEASGDNNIIFVVTDCDKRECSKFKNSLVELGKKCMINTKTIFCLAIEEMEAWLLGDEKAILDAYPNARISAKSSYKQDSIIGTWEVLADVVYPGGYRRMKKDCSSYYEIGTCKIEWAQKIGSHLTLSQNTSPSFNHFIKKLNAVVSG